MAWYSDEEYELRQDIRDKSITARSARRTRTHCGKSGPVKFPSDFLSAKERKAMNGEVVSYDLSKPMSWERFKAMPRDLQINYIKMLRHRFEIPDTYIAEMFGTTRRTMGIHFKDLKLLQGKGSHCHNWKREEFEAWRRGEEIIDIHTEETTEEATDENAPVERVEAVEAENFQSRPFIVKDVDFLLGDTEDRQSTISSAPVIPDFGKMTFTAPADQILETMRNVLGNANVIMTIDWTVVMEDC